jgi:hypothetical protein
VAGSLYTEPRPHPRTDVFDDEPLVGSKSCRIEPRGILVKPQHLVGHAVRADDHGRRSVRGLERPAPLSDHLTVTGEDDGLGRI